LERKLAHVTEQKMDHVLESLLGLPNGRRKGGWSGRVWASVWADSRALMSRAEPWADELDRSTVCASALSLAGQSMGKAKVPP